MSTQLTCGGGGGGRSLVFCSGDGGGGGGEMHGCGNGVRESCPPPFLMKLFDMVDDSKTNSIISWSLDGTTFIIWDHLKFSEKLLHAYFKHENLSSFIYQLNNYGFRKCGVAHQWEYGNRYFQAGRPDLLPLIKRRNHLPGATPVTRRRRRTSSPADEKNNSDGADVRRLEKLKDEIASSKMEIEILKNKLEEMEFQIEASQAKVKNAQKQLEELKKLLAKACRGFMRPKKRAEIEKDKSDDDGKISKKTKPDQTLAAEEGSMDLNGGEVQHEEMVLKEDAVSEIQPVSSTEDSANRVEKEDGDADAKKKQGDSAYWQEMMMGDDDDDVCEIDEGTFEKRKQQAQIAAELLDLIHSKQPIKQHSAQEAIHIS